MANDYNFEDFLRRLEDIRSRGLPEDLLERVPGLQDLLESNQFDLTELEPIERILRAMTLEERLDPELLEGEEGYSRRERIAERSGCTVGDVNALILQFQMLCHMLETMSPEQVTQQILDDVEPKEEWQDSPDAWKAGADDEPDPELVEREERKAFEAKLDEILAKLHRVGRANLAPGELAHLEEASRRYRERRANR
ncbi:MAG: hypothetical protein KDD82_18505 [Planctomycetes bacterium]|nr:hypothetical protein [Planctomycetota bacterium]